MHPAFRRQDIADSLRAAGLLTPGECDFFRSLFAPDHPLGEVIRRARSWHLHIRVDDTDRLPSPWLAAHGLTESLRRPGFVEFADGEGGSLSFSSIAIAEADGADLSARRPRPHLDHIGFDFRAADLPGHGLESARTIGEQLGWEVVTQGGDGRPVSCCFSEVAEKAWLFPPLDAAMPDVALELAVDPLTHDSEQMGADLRPSRPGEGGAPGCCAG